MAQASVSSLVSFLQEKEFIAKSQLQELPGNGQSLEAAAFLREAARRQWLTEYQVSRITEGHVKDLILGPYRILEPIGEGGMGQVFKARHVQMDRIVGLKIIPKEYLANANAVSRFYREVRAVAKLSHPNVVAAHDAGQEGDTHYLAMEFVDGIDLARLVRQSGPLPIAQACDFMRQAALGLQHANEKGLVHRDIKPGNIIVGRGNGAGPPAAKVLDFGLARFEDQSGQTKLTKLGNVLGTVDYISPEQAGDARDVDTRADIFSLGCALFYVLTGKPPFAGATAMDRMMARCVRDADSVRTARPEVPAALERVLAKMLARNRADRYQSPAEVAASLEPFTSMGASAPPKREEPAGPQSLSNAGREATAKQARRASSSAVLPSVMKKRPQEHTEILPSFEFETVAEAAGLIAGPRRKATRVGQGTWSSRTVIVVGLVGLALGAMAIWVGVAFPRKTGEPAHNQPAAKGGPSVTPPQQKGKLPKPPQPPTPVIPAKEITNSIGMKLVYIPPGKFIMGSPGGEQGRFDYEHQHEVEITKSFYMGAYEVTQEEYEKVTNKAPSWFSSSGHGKNAVAGMDTPRFPVEMVSWEEAMEFCRLLSQKEGGQYDLPTEAEREYACRANTRTVFHYGDSLSSAQANFIGRFPYGGANNGPDLQRTTKVDSYQPNAWGLYDMHGNVFDWCKDWYEKDYYKNSPARDPQGPGTGKFRVLRGGCWASGGANCRSAYRGWSSGPGERSNGIGFRVVLRPGPPDPPADKERRAAEWVLSLGGKIRIVTAGHEREIGPDEKLAAGPLELQQIDLWSKRLDANSLAQLEGLPNLRKLGLERTDMTDAGLVHLKRLSQLKELDLQNNPEIGDAGLANLKGLSTLERLVLSGTRVSDKGLPSLYGLSALKRLNLMNTKVTATGIGALRKALPTCQIEADEIQRKEPPPPKEESWVQLFNGKDKTGWHEARGTWVVRNSELVGKGGETKGSAAHLETIRKDFSNFHLRIEMVNNNRPRAICVRNTLAEGFSGYLVNTGGILGEVPAGSIGRIQGPWPKGFRGWEFPAKTRSLKDGDPYVLEILAKGNNISTFVNDEFAAECTDEITRAPSGSIRLICWAQSGEVRFKRIEIKELPAAIGAPEVEEGFVPLFNGKSDFTGTDPAALKIKQVAATKDPKTGLIVGGKNETALVKKLTEINGIKIADLEFDMRPGRLSRLGFLGKGEKLLDVLAADNRYIVEGKGLTHQEIAKHLHILGALGLKLKAIGRKSMPFVYEGKRFQVEMLVTRGFQESPFQDDTKSGSVATLDNLDNGKQVRYALLVPHMIERYGFYEGKGTPYRVEPRKILEVLDFLTAKKK